MKLVTKVLLWVQILLSCYVAIVSTWEIVTVLWDYGKNGFAEPLLFLVVLIFGALLVYSGFQLYFNINTLLFLKKATQKSQIKTWRKVGAFFFSNPIVACLLICMDDDELAPEQANPDSSQDPVSILMEYKSMLDAGCISAEEYQEKKAQLFQK